MAKSLLEGVAKFPSKIAPLCVAALFGAADPASALIRANFDTGSPPSPTSANLFETLNVKIKLFNDASFASTQAAFSLTLPANLFIAATPSLTNTCGGSFTATNGATEGSISLTGGTIPAKVGANDGECFISFNITSSVKNTYAIVIPAGSLTGKTPGGATEMNATAVQSTMTFSPNLVQVQMTTDIGLFLAGHETTVRRIRLTNTNPYPLTGAGVFWDLRPHAANIRIRDDLPKGSTCGMNLSVAAVAQTSPGAPLTSTLTASGGTIPANSTCEIFVTIEGSRDPFQIFNATALKHQLAGGAVTSNELATNNTTFLSGGGEPVFETRSGVAITGFTFNGVENASINLNDTTTARLTYSFRNWNAQAITGFMINNPLPSITNPLTGSPAPMTLQSVETNTCGGTINLTPNNKVELVGGFLDTGAAPGTPGVQFRDCVVTVIVKVTACGAYENTWQPGTYDGQHVRGGGRTILAASCALFDVTQTLNRIGSPFGTTLMHSGDTVNAVFTVRNFTSAVPVTNIRIPNNLAQIGSGFRVGPLGLLNNSCGGTPSVTPGTSSYQMNGITLPPATTCSYTVQLISSGDSATPLGVFALTTTPFQSMSNRIPPNTIKFDANGQADQLYPQNVAASYEMRAPIFLSKRFLPGNETTPGIVATGGISRLQITIRRFSSDRIGIENIYVKDVLTGGLTIAPNPNPVSACGGTFNAPAGGTTIELTGAAIPYPTGSGLERTCTFEINVKAPNTAGLYDNVIPGDLLNQPKLHFNATTIRPDAAPSNVINLTRAAAQLQVVETSLTVAKQFDPSDTPVGQPSRVTITIQNIGSGALNLTDVGLVDTLDPNMLPFPTLDPTFTEPGGAANTANCSGNSFDVKNTHDSAGPAFVKLENASIKAGQTCLFSFNVMGTTAGTDVPNIIPAGRVTSVQNVSNSNTVFPALTVSSGVGVTLNFDESTIAHPGSSILTATITNGLGFDLTGDTTSLLVNLEPGIIIDSTVPLTAGPGCGTPSSVNGGATLMLSGGTFPEGQECKITARVISSSTGKFDATIAAGDFKVTNAPSSTISASATLTVINHPTVTKTFVQPMVALGGEATIRFVVAHQTPAADLPAGLSDVTFEDALVDMEVASPVQIVGVANPGNSGCAGFTHNASPGASSVTFSGISLNAFNPAVAGSGRCEFTLVVKATKAGLLPNKVTNISTEQTGPAPDSATANLRVVEPLTVTKSFPDAPIVDGVPQVQAGTATRMAFEIRNPNPVAVSLSTPGFTDLFPISPGQMYVPATPGVGLTLTNCPTGIAVQNLAGSANLAAGATGMRVSGGSFAPTASNQTGCQISVNIKVAEAGDYTNTTSEILSGGGQGPSSSAPLRATALTARLELVKSASFNANGSIKYKFRVTNTGNVNVTGIRITDGQIGVNAVATSPDSLSPGASVELLRDYTPVTADFNAGKITNSATVSGSFVNASEATRTTTDLSTTGTDPQGATLSTLGTEDPTITHLTQSPGLVLTKGFTVGSAPVVGDVVNYTFNVRNSGNVTLSNLKIEDPILGLTGATALAVTPDVLAPNATGTATATRALTQADIDAGRVTNAATVIGAFANRDGAAQTWSDDSAPSNAANGAAIPPGSQVAKANTVTNLGQAPKLTVIKSASFPQGPVVDNEITYSFTVRNDGNVTISNLTVTDALLNLSAVPLNSVTLPTPASTTTLAPGESVSFTAPDYTITQDDVDAGQVSNSATAFGTHTTPTGTAPASDVSTAGTDPTGTPIASAGPGSDATVVAIARNVTLEVTKTVADITGLSVPPEPGDIISYSIKVENTGNVTLADIEVDDPLIDAIDPVGTIATLAPGDFETVEADYAITQADIDAGTVNNTATAKTIVDGTPVEKSGSVATEITQSSGLTLTKVGEIRDQDTDAVITGGAAKLDDIILFTFTVENTGNVTLSDVEVEDAMIGLGAIDVISGTPASMEPGAEATFEARYTITQDDIDAGNVSNQATASGEHDGAAVQSLQATAEVAITRNPDMTFEKTSLVTDGHLVGGSIDYTFTVENTGNVTLTDISIEDIPLGLTGATALAATPDPLAPGQTATVTASRVITQSDLDAGLVTNTATAFATDPEGEVMERTDTVDTDLDQRPSVTLDKSAAVSGSGILGDTITYSFKVTNTGNVTLENVTITDPMTGLGAITLTEGDADNLAPNDEVVFEASYTITQADIDAGQVENQATAKAIIKGSGNTTADASDDDDETVALTGTAGITLMKGARLESTGAVGTKVFYDFLVINTGTLTLHNVTITDDRIDVENLVLPAPLAPGRANAQTITAEYVIQQADVDAGVIENQAKVEATAPNGVAGAVKDLLSSATTREDGSKIPETEWLDREPTKTRVKQPAPDLLITKTADLRGLGRVGDEVVYTITVENIGNVDLPDVRVTDPMVNLDETILLVEGASRSFTASYFLTPEDIIRRQVENTAHATFMGLSGMNVERSAVAVVYAEGELSLTKVANSSAVSVGQSVTYTLKLENSSLAGAVSADLIDTLPTGFSYVAGSARVNGVAIEPENDGRTLVWRSVTAPAGGAATVTYDLVVGASVGPGEHVNRAQGFDPANGAAVTDEAKAIVRIIVEPVFDCATVIGRVFEDSNGDGYFRDEKGLAFVRLISPTGMQITTDEHGRFSVPCADLPRDIGANFMLKLDEASLPEGYGVTTENPRVVRVTPGMVTKMNFGAAKAKTYVLNLRMAGFDETGRPIEDMRAALRELAADIKGERVTLRLVLQLEAKDTPNAAKASLDRLAEEIRQIFGAAGAPIPEVVQSLIAAK